MAPMQPQQPGISSQEIQQIVQTTIANEMKKNVHYLDQTRPQPGMPGGPIPYEVSKRTEPLINEEELKLRSEEQEIRKQVPIDIAPFIKQTLGLNTGAGSS